NDDERRGVERARRLQHPVHHAPPQDRMEVLRQRGPHPGPEASGHHDSSESRRHQRLNDGWGARIRTWDHGTKTRCLTTWPRPTAGTAVYPARSPDPSAPVEEQGGESDG